MLKLSWDFPRKSVRWACSSRFRRYSELRTEVTITMKSMLVLDWLVWLLNYSGSAGPWFPWNILSLSLTCQLQHDFTPADWNCVCLTTRAVCEQLTNITWTWITVIPGKSWHPIPSWVVSFVMTRVLPSLVWSLPCLSESVIAWWGKLQPPFVDTIRTLSRMI